MSRNCILITSKTTTRWNHYGFHYFGLHWIHFQCYGNTNMLQYQHLLTLEILSGWDWTALWHTNRPIEFPTANNHTCKMDATGYLWHDGFQSLIKSLALVLCWSPTTIPTAIPRLTRAIMFRVHFFCLTTRILFGNAVFSFKFMIQRIFSIMRESIQLLREFLKHFWKILEHDTMHTLNGFTTFAY